jgi:F-box-like
MSGYVLEQHPPTMLLTRCDVGQVVSIDMLPDDVLLEIFDFFMEKYEHGKEFTEDWQILVHVCRRWRSIVFGSPRRLNLRLFCSNETPARDTLDVWPPLPLFIRRIGGAGSVDDIVAVLERSDRVCDIELQNLERSDLEIISAAMQVPFPELTSLELRSNGETVSALPDSFLGGSAPRLRYLLLAGIPFPGLPKLLLSATQLAYLFLYNIPHSGYFTPEAIVTALSTLTRLEHLRLFFESPQSRPDPAHQRPPPPTRSVLPNLAFFNFKGDSEYMEVVMAHIDAPRLGGLYTTLFNDIVFDTPRLTQFISRTPKIQALEKAHVTFDGDAAAVKLSSLEHGRYDTRLKVKIPCRELDWQVSSMEQICASCLPPLPTLDLHIDGNPHYSQHWQGNVNNALWLQLLQPFTSVKNLYLSEEIAGRIVPALQELVGDRATEVLPTLENIFLEEGQQSGSVQEGIQQVIAVRQATNHPIAVSYQEKLYFDPPEEVDSIATDSPAQSQ